MRISDKMNYLSVLMAPGAYHHEKLVARKSLFPIHLFVKENTVQYKYSLCITGI